MTTKQPYPEELKRVTEERDILRPAHTTCRKRDGDQVSWTAHVPTPC